MVCMMSDLRGRCMNVEFCSVAVSQRVVTLPEGSKFLCPKCGEALEEANASRAAGRAKALLAVQAVILVVGGAAIAYKLAGGFDAAPTSPPNTELAAAKPEAPSRPCSVALAAAALLHLLHGLLDLGLVVRLARLVVDLLGDAEGRDLLCHTHDLTVPIGGKAIRRNP